MEDIQIRLLDTYQPITEEDIRTGKNFVLRRESAANGLASLIDALMSDATARMVQIAYKYGIDPENFQMSPQYNEQMFREMSQILDELEDEIFDLIESYSTRCTKNEDKKKMLLLWILSLGKNGKGLRRSLEDRLWMLSRDIEAMIAAAMTAKMDVTRAISTIRSNLHTSYQMPGMQAAFAHSSLYKAQYIRTHGVKKGNRGSSNSESNNIIRFAKTTVQMAWMRYHYRLYEEQGAAGYVCFRGSTFPCSECDDICGIFIPMERGMVLPVHANCCCYAVPVFNIND